jgi:hypothetical protein
MSTATAGALAVISYPSRVYVVCDIQSDDSEDSNRSNIYNCIRYGWWPSLTRNTATVYHSAFVAHSDGWKAGPLESFAETIKIDTSIDVQCCARKQEAANWDQLSLGLGCMVHVYHANMHVTLYCDWYNGTPSLQPPSKEECTSTLGLNHFKKKSLTKFIAHRLCS